jgi:hypothetical protein
MPISFFVLFSLISLHIPLPFGLFVDLLFFQFFPFFVVSSALQKRMVRKIFEAIRGRKLSNEGLHGL